MKNLNLTTDDLKVIDQVLVVPLHATNPEELIKETGLELGYIISLHDKLNEFIDKKVDIDESKFGSDDLKNLFKVYMVAIPIAKNFDDIQTLTGYDEEEVDVLAEKIKTALVS